MQKAMAVHHVEGFEQRDQHLAKRGLRRGRRLVPEPILHGESFDVWRNQVGRAVALNDIVDGKQIGVAEPGESPRFLVETLPGELP